MQLTHKLLVFLSMVNILSYAAKNEKKPFFDLVKKVETTPVEQQFRSNTCWSFSVLGMLESEHLKETSKAIQLSKMFVVYYTYLQKAEHYIRMHGKANFSGGGALNDPLDIMQKYGIVPNEAYSGLLKDNELPDHTLMDLELKLFVDSVLNSSHASKDWRSNFEKIMQKYMGVIPENFNHQGKTYTPVDFFETLGIKPENYQMVSSFNYKPFYSRFVLEVPDNWSSSTAFNLPLADFMTEIDHSLTSGLSIAITVDISENGFDFWHKGMAIIEPSDTTAETGSFIINDEKRQAAFDNFETTDDHSLLLTGIAYNDNGKKFYLAKNSWGSSNSCFSGFLYLSENYVRYKTIAALFNIKGLTLETQKQLNPCSK